MEEKGEESAAADGIGFDDAEELPNDEDEDEDSEDDFEELPSSESCGGKTRFSFRSRMSSSFFKTLTTPLLAIWRRLSS